MGTAGLLWRAPDHFWANRPPRSAQRSREVTVAAALYIPYTNPWENGPVLLGRGLKRPLKQMWPMIKQWDQKFLAESKLRG